jgi:hypothetical protein
VQKSLELERLVAIVGDNHGSGQALSVERDAVQQAKLVRPKALDFLVEVVRGKAKVELDAVGRAGTLAGGLAKELPARVSGKPVLRELGGGFMVGGGAEDREDNGNPAANWFRAVELGRLAHPQLLDAGASLPADDGGTEQQDLDAVTGGQNGRDLGVAIRDGNLGLWGQAGRRSQSGGLVGSVNHACGLMCADCTKRFGVWRHDRNASGGD